MKLKDTDQPIYNGHITAGALLIPESRAVASLLKNKDLTPDQWQQAITVDNILQKRSPETAKRQARLIKNRLSLMPSSFLDLIEHPSHEVVTQALLAAAIKHSRLIGDFLDQVVREHWRTFQKQLTNRDWQNFLHLCSQRDPHVESWSESTADKLRRVVFTILVQASYIDGARSRNLLPVTVNTEVREFLVKYDEKYVLHCMQAAE
jgi:hypothetical protein